MIYCSLIYKIYNSKHFAVKPLKAVLVNKILYSYKIL